MAVVATTYELYRMQKVNANGFTVPMVQGVSGPYEYIVGIWPPDPIVGKVHLAVSLTSNERPVTEATVIVTGRANGGTVVEGPAPATGYYLESWSYELDMNLSQPCRWTFEVGIDSPCGTTAFKSPSEVADGQGSTVPQGRTKRLPARNCRTRVQLGHSCRPTGNSGLGPGGLAVQTPPASRATAN